MPTIELFSFIKQVIENFNGESDFLNFGLWVTTVTCVSGAILFAVIGALMAIVNTTLTPVETIAGRTGLFFWNSLSSNNNTFYTIYIDTVCLQ